MRKHITTSRPSKSTARAKASCASTRAGQRPNQQTSTNDALTIQVHCQAQATKAVHQQAKEALRNQVQIAQEPSATKRRRKQVQGQTVEHKRRAKELRINEQVCCQEVRTQTSTYQQVQATRLRIQARATRLRANIQASKGQLQVKKTADAHERKRHAVRRERTCPIDQTWRAGDRRGVEHPTFRPTRGPQGLYRQEHSEADFQKDPEDF